MRVSPQNLIRIAQIFEHTVQFFFTMVLDDVLAFIISLQVHAHTNSICLGMKLSADHVGIEANTHYGALVGNMSPHFFNT